MITQENNIDATFCDASMTKKISRKFEGFQTFEGWQNIQTFKNSNRRCITNNR